MHELLADAVGERMQLAAYRADFARHFWTIDRLGFWKLERQQHFEEPGDDSWEAFARGDWAESLRLLEARLADLEAEHRRIAQHGFAVRRVRVVEEPIISYLQWELHLLHLREQSGSGVRVVRAEQVARYEATAPLPELCTLGTDVMYEVIYDERGILDGARRYADPGLIGRGQQLIAELYASGEPLSDYFRRRVAGLPAPVLQQSA
jgi:hypothetical protein